MIQKLKSLLGIKEYEVQIEWGRNKKEYFYVEAWDKEHALRKSRKINHDIIFYHFTIKELKIV